MTFPCRDDDLGLAGFVVHPVFLEFVEKKPALGGFLFLDIKTSDHLFHRPHLHPYHHRHHGLVFHPSRDVFLPEF